MSEKQKAARAEPVVALDEQKRIQNRTVRENRLMALLRAETKKTRNAEPSEGPGVQCGAPERALFEPNLLDFEGGSGADLSSKTASGGLVGVRQ